MVLYTVVAGSGQRNGQPLPPAETQALLHALNVKADGPTQVLLVGKDGGVKVRQQGDVEPKALFDTIDRMPMRQSAQR